MTLGPSTGACGRRVRDQIVGQGGKIGMIRQEKNIEAISGGGRIRVGSDGRSRCLRWSGADFEREVEASGGIIMMDTGM